MGAGETEKHSKLVTYLEVTRFVNQDNPTASYLLKDAPTCPLSSNTMSRVLLTSRRSLEWWVDLMDMHQS
jgi:hypothetical protein